MNRILTAMVNEVAVMAELVEADLKGQPGTSTYNNGSDAAGDVTVTIASVKLYGGAEAFSWKVEGEVEEWSGLADTVEVATYAACMAAVAHIYADSSL